VSAILSGVGGLTDNFLLGYAIGRAAGPALEPFVQDLANEAWSLHSDKPLTAGTAAEVAAEDYAALDAMRTEASYTGIDSTRFQLLYDVTLTGPGMGELLAMVRRGTIDGATFTHGLRKAKFEPLWDTALTDLSNARIPVADLAYMVVRGLVPDAGLLPVPPPSTTEKVQRYPVAQLDTLHEAASWGWDEERFRALVGRSGLSIAPISAAQAYFRNVIGLDDFYLAIAEGDLRNEWRDAILETARQIPTDMQFVEGELRGYLTTAQRLAGTARHGMAAADSDLLFAITGRPLAVHAITTGLARGGKFGGTYADVPEPYQDAIRRSAIRPEYAGLAYANRYSYPSAFVLRSLATGGELDEPTTKQTLLDIGWPPDLVDKVVTAWFGTTTATTDPNVKKAHTKAWTEAQTSYIAQESTAADVQPIFQLLGIDAAAQSEILTAWNEVRALVRKQLSPAQVKKAIGQPGKDTAWATTQLLDRGYSPDDAATFLAE